MKNDSLDEFIRGKLGNNNIPQNGDAWEKYQDYKESMDSADVYFDSFVKEKINSAEINSTPSWALFSEKLIEVENEEFDEYIQENMNLENGPVYSEQAWEKFLMVRRENIAQNIQLIITRILEVAAVFLILWSTAPLLFNNFSFIDSEEIYTENIELAEHLKVPILINEIEENTKLKNKIVQNRPVDQVESSFTSSDPKTLISDNSDVDENRAKERNYMSQYSARMNMSKSYPDLTSSNYQAYHFPYMFNNSNRFAVSSEKNNLMIAQLSQEWSELSGTDPYSSLNEVQDLTSYLSLQNSPLVSDDLEVKGKLSEIKSLAVLDAKEITSPYKELAHSEIVSSSNSKSPLSIAVHLNGNKEIITTSEDKIYNVDSKKSLSNSIGFGIDITHLIKDKTALSLGLNYNLSSYRTPHVIEWYEGLPGKYKGISLEEIELSTFSIPVEINYDLAQIKNTKLYCNLGTTLNLITNTQYFIYNYDSGTNEKIAYQKSADNFPDQNQTQLFKKDFTDGYFQSGTFKENYYMAVHAGLGIAHQSSENFSVFLESDYHHNLFRKEYGPNKDVIDRLGFSAGIKYHL